MVHVRWLAHKVLLGRVECDVDHCGTRHAAGRDRARGLRWRDRLERRVIRGLHLAGHAVKGQPRVARGLAEQDAIDAGVRGVAPLEQRRLVVELLGQRSIRYEAKRRLVFYVADERLRALDALLRFGIGLELGLGIELGLGLGLRLRLGLKLRFSARNGALGYGWR